MNEKNRNRRDFLTMKQFRTAESVSTENSDVSNHHGPLLSPKESVPTIPRRGFLKISGVATAQFGVAATHLDKLPALFLQEDTPTVEESPTYLSVAPPEIVASEPGAAVQWSWGTTEYSMTPEGLYNIHNRSQQGNAPDGATTSWVEGTTRYVQFPAGRQQFQSTVTSEGLLSEAHEVFRPDRQPTEFGTWEYGGVPTVFEVDGQKYGLAHLESWQYADNGANFTAQIGLVRWDIPTQKWQLIDTMIEGMNPIPADVIAGTVSGAGQPTAYVEGEYLYYLFTEWNYGQDAIHAGRVRLDQLMDKNAWTRWNEGGFSQLVNNAQNSTAVITPEYAYSALPNVITDQNGRHLVIFEQANQFSICEILDSETMTLSQPQTLIKFPEAELKYEKGKPWYSYPSFISTHASRPQEFVTDAPGLMTYSKGVRGDTEYGHGMFMVPLTIS